MMHLFFNESKRLLNLGKYSILGYEKVSKENVKCQKIYNKKMIDHIIISLILRVGAQGININKNPSFSRL